MKQLLCLGFIGISSLSFGQTNSNPKTSSLPVQKEQISNGSKMSKRVKIVRTKKVEVPQKVQEPIKKD